jgi:lysophospholipase L1-like esterase
VYFCIQSDNSENRVPDWSNLKVWYKFSKLNSLNKEISLLYKVFGYRDRRFAFLGDSITDPNHIGTTKNYWQFLEEMLGLKSYSYGANGAQSNQIITQVDAAIAAATTDGEKIDVLSLFFGTNDYNADIPIGEWYTETEESVVRHGSTVTLKKKVFNTNNSTFKGRLYNGVLYAKQQLPDTKIIVITPIHRGQYGNETNRQPSELYANALGLYIDDYIAAVKELGNVLAVEVIDLNAICGLYPLLDEFAKFFSSASDKLHPNALGHYRMACAIASKLISTNNKVV